MTQGPHAIFSRASRAQIVPLPESNARRSDAVGVGISLVIPVNTLLIANLLQQARTERIRC